MAEVKENIIKTKSFEFALRIVKVYKMLVAEQGEYVMSKQFIRSGTAVGALIREAEHAESKADFIHKLSISLKEANETMYWLDLLHQSHYLSDDVYNDLQKKNDELLRLLVSIIKSSKNNLKK